MRNLRNVKHSKFKIDSNATSALTAATWDPSDDSLILAFGPDQDSPAITLRRLSSAAEDIKDAVDVASWDAPSPNPDLAVDQIVDLHCFPETKTIHLILKGGDIIVVREEPQPGEDLIEIVGSVDAGIHAAKWSPDEELLVVCTGAGTMIFMTRHFDSTANITISAEDLKVSNHVSVGWGKKETQFKGRGAAKALRDPTVPEHVDEGILSAQDDGRISISWRGDGQFVAVNSVLESEPKRRVIRVYSRDGTLESVTEPINGLEGALSWKPSGQLISSIQRHLDHFDVVFFERNGLRHGEFDLRLTADDMTRVGSNITLLWNVDSSVLAVSLHDRVQLWTVNNYHYYLKQEILFTDTIHSASTTTWHPEKPLHLACLVSQDLRRLSYRSEVCRGPVVPPHDMGTVAVIDGKKLKITPLRLANVPPPMAYDEVDLPNNIVDITICEDGTEMALLHREGISIITCDYGANPPRKGVITAFLDWNIAENTTAGIEFPGQRAKLVRTDHDRIYYAPLDTLEAAATQPSLSADHFDPSKVSWRSPSGEGVFLYLSDNGVLQVRNQTQCLRIPGCTSFLATNSHLAYTTSQHLLKFIHLHSGLLSLPPDEPEKDERCRSIERGAKIVTVMPSAYSLVLQMPRGNLETIYPRALVLAGIRDSVRQRDYKKAFLTCRTHRVDMNILHDYAPQQFMQDIELFLNQVKKTEYVDLFLSSLAEANVSETMYKDTLAPSEPAVVENITNGEPNGLVNDTSNLSVHQKTNGSLANGAIVHSNTSGTSKINKICDAFLSVLLAHQAERLQNIVTAHVCKSPPDLEAGVQLVSGLRKESNQDHLEQAVEHICFLADVNQLYDTALGVYDLDVALLIAQQSQKDPREYLPYLQELNDMQRLRRQFKIDDDLKRYQKALKHLHALGEFEELTAYMSKHDLYPAAIELYRYDNTRLTALMQLYANHLNSCNKFKEAGIAYEYILDHTSAFQAYRAVGMWRECLANAAMVGSSQDDVRSLAQDLAASLEEGKDFTAAATIHLDYLEDLEGSARLLCKGCHFAEASRQVTLRGRPELLQSVVDTCLVEASATMTELLAEMKSQLGAQVPRLQELRQKKADDPMAFLDGADGGDGDIPDNISLAQTDASTSGGTFMTRYTNRSMGTLATNATRKTSKNRRREERKRARGKKGTVYEEEYLVNSIARLVERLNDTSDDLSRLVDGLMRRAMRERAIAVQTAMDDVFMAVRGCMSEVFADPATTTEQVAEATEGAEEPTSRPWGGEGVLWEALTSQRQQAPTLKEFKKLSLIP